MATQSTILTGYQIQSLFKNASPLYVRAFQNLFGFFQQLQSGAVIGASASTAPLNPGDLAFTALSNTQLKLQFMGSDGVIRSNTLTLS